MFDLAHPRRSGRAGKWTKSKAVTFIVTLAATRTVTLAARSAGMSRKAAYALRARDPLFAAGWREALKAGGSEVAQKPVQGDKVHEVHDSRFSRHQGNSANVASTGLWFRDTLAAWQSESATGQLAPRQTLP